MKMFDNYEIHACKTYTDDEGSSFTEQCDDADGEFWTLYGHIPGEGVQAIGDFATAEDADEVHQRITGKPYTGSHVRGADRMVPGNQRGKLLNACRLALTTMQASLEVEDPQACTQMEWESEVLATLREAIAEAEAPGRAA